MKKDFDYKIIRLKREDDSLINQLLDTAASIHNRKRDSMDWLKWKYFDSPFGECICLLAIKNNEIAGEVTFGQYKLILNGEIIKCLISYQTMVNPKHQKKGLFSTLTKHVLKIAQTEKIDLVFNFPNKASYIPFERLNFTPINHLKNYINFANKLNFLATPISLKKPFVATTLKSVDLTQKELLKNLRNTIKPLNIKGILTPNRTYDFLKWRYFTYPLYDYKIINSKLGWAIVRTGNRGKLKEVQLMEIFPNNDDYNSFIRNIKSEIKKTLNPDVILVNISGNHPLNNVLKINGFISLPHHISFFTFAINQKLKPYLKKDKWILTATEFHRY